jgi:ABC-type multidrug transport system fused ATPase/permease subunit
MKMIAVVAFALTYSTGALAQPAAQSAGAQAPAPQVPAGATRAAIPELDAREVRRQLQMVLAKYPPEIGHILLMDPTMLTNEQYLAQYPGIQQFLREHPEVARNPGFYLEFVRRESDSMRSREPASDAMRMWNNMFESISIFAVLVFVASMLAWLVKTVLNHRRWLRASRLQSEVHHKLLDRFAGTNELLAYIQTPSGRRFLDAAPIPVEGGASSASGAPLSRILWSVQAGIVLVVGGVGFQYVSGRIAPEVGQGLWTIGVLAAAFGLGFILAGAFSFVMSRRLGLLDTPPAMSERDSTTV